jgi:AraC-like DNA-binding protein
MTADRLGQTRHGSTTTELGLLGSARDYDVRRVAPAGDLAGLVERHWVVTWDLPAGRPSAADLLPHPCVNLVFAAGQLMIAGVGRERFSYPLSGAGRVFGVKFRPGGFLPYLGRPVGALTGRTVPASAVWGADAPALAAALAAAADVEDLVALAEEFLRRRAPAPDPTVARVGQVVHALLRDRSIQRVDQAAERFGMSARSLQRLFQRYVGVSPKWVLRRYRLHEAARRLVEGTAGSWAEVAAELGYYDQSHFIRDFTAAVGTTPAGYAAACARGLAAVGV